MSAAEIDEFSVETKLIEWDTYLGNYAKGIAIWGLKEDQISPEHGFKQILLLNPTFFDSWYYPDAPNTNFKNRSTQVYEHAILNKQRYCDFFQGNQQLT